MILENLFSKRPDLMRHFSFQQTEEDQSPTKTIHAKKVVGLIDQVICDIQDSKDISTSLKNLGEKHVLYGIEKKDFNDMGIAILTTLSVYLNESFTVDAKNAWVAFLKQIFA